MSGPNLRILDNDEVRDVLGFLVGYCANDPTFQDGLTAAYKSVMRARIRRAEQDPEGLALVQQILDRKAASSA